MHPTIQLERDLKRKKENNILCLGRWQLPVSPELFFIYFLWSFCFVSFELDRVSFFSPDYSGTHCVVWTSLIIMAILLHQPPKSWDFKCEPLHTASFYFKTNPCKTSWFPLGFGQTHDWIPYTYRRLHLPGSTELLERENWAWMSRWPFSGSHFPHTA